jgi:hypothetical protein
MSARVSFVLLIIGAVVYSYVAERAVGYSATLPLPSFTHSEPALYGLFLEFYAVIAFIAVALVPAILILKLHVSRPLLVALVAGLPIFPITAYALYLASQSPDLAAFMLTPRVLVGSAINVVVFLFTLPALVLLGQKCGPLTRT